MTQSDLEQQLLQLPPSDKLRIIELLIKSLSSLWPREPVQNLQTEQPQPSPAQPQQSWPELIDSLAGNWSDLPAFESYRSDLLPPRKPDLF